ncbi:hypothetical protein K466DRAFT_222224 [Polyporus arcularius HHB13444]|uniref:Uncharacterized protein n=1 Tax=Polyporus arcularius HHB13444 TaxID=1314778 RepID=A0A5C3P4F0_9APHY|nr:hypothetical protein K466DRAFT_222224 [Polyporus arcularius HHB13444]
MGGRLSLIMARTVRGQALIGRPQGPTPVKCPPVLLLALVLPTRCREVYRTRPLTGKAKLRAPPESCRFVPCHFAPSSDPAVSSPMKQISKRSMGASERPPLQLKKARRRNENADEWEKEGWTRLDTDHWVEFLKERWGEPGKALLRSEDRTIEVG